MPKIEVDQDLEFQEKEWLAERLGWLIGLVLLLAALAGVFGKGPLSYATRASGPLRVSWERLARNNSSLDLQVSLADAPGQDGQLQVWLDRAYIDEFQIETVTPLPASMHIAGSRLVVVFDAPTAQAGAAGPAFQATFQVRPQHAGIFRASVGEQTSGQSLNFEQVIFP
jgi:hypothetical protein